MPSNIVYLGLKGHVTALDKVTGRTVWQTRLRTTRAVSGEAFVSLLVEDGVVIAHTFGELYGLDAESGQILWNNELDGLGYGIASLATDRGSNSGDAAVAYRKSTQATAAMAAATTAGVASSR